MLNEQTQQSALATLLSQLHVTYPDCGIVSTAPARKWDDGTVVGNGSAGALAFARTSDEELVLSHEELFLPLFPFAGYLPVKQHYQTIQQLVIDGKADEAQRLIRQLKIDRNFPHDNTTDPFVGVCSLDMHMRERADAEAYVRSVDFETGEAVVAWQDATGLFRRAFFYSRADDCLAIRLTSPTRDRLSLAIGLREIAYHRPTDPRDHDIYAKTIDHSVVGATATRLTYRMYFKQRFADQRSLGCAAVVRVIQHGGQAREADGQVHIQDADELLMLVRVAPHRRGETLSVDALAQRLEAIEPDYGRLLSAHAAIHGEMFGRCRLRLSAPNQHKRSGEAMFAESSIGKTDPALVEKTFAAARHGIISSTGKLPPALQGVWTGTWKPMWSGDYTLNGNVQSMVAASLCGNHLECQLSLMDYLDSLMDDFRENARELLGFRGTLIPWRSSTHGKTHYLAYKQYHHNFPGVFWFPGAAWFAQIYYDYYLYTGDEQFFHDRLAPFLLDAAALYEDFLTYQRDGVYVIAPDSSAENENGDDIWMAPNPTHTIAAIKQLLRTLLRHADQLGVGQARVARWRDMLAKLPDYAIGANGALQEWAWPGIENNEAHRHASHLYPLWFGVDPQIAASDALRQACRVAIEARMAPRRADRGGFMAFGYTQFGMAAAHLGDCEHAYESVEYLAGSYWSPIMVSQHNHDPDGPAVLNMDISGGLPAVVITMLVQSLMPDEPGGPWVVRLLPCLPDTWPSGSLTGVLCRGGFEVDIAWQNGKMVDISVLSLRGERLKLHYGGCDIDIDTTPGARRTLVAADWQ